MAAHVPKTARRAAPGSHGVLTSLLSARAPQRVRTHPSLRIPRQSLSRFPPGTIPATAILQFFSACRSWNRRGFGRGFFPLALTTLRRGHDRDAEIYGYGVVHMRLLRFLVADSSRAVLGCAPAHGGIRVPTPRRQVPRATGRAPSGRHVRRSSTSPPGFSRSPVLNSLSTPHPSSIQIP